MRFFRFRKRLHVAVTIQCNSTSLKQDCNGQPRLPVRKRSAGDDELAGPSEIAAEAPEGERGGGEKWRLQQKRGPECKATDRAFLLSDPASLTEANADEHFDKI